MYHQEKEIFNDKMTIPLENSRGLSDDRLLWITISDFQDKLEIKLKDPNDYSFNYTETVDLGDFEIIRLGQSLDINFAEFKVQIVEMLQQFQRREMYLKCKTFDSKCSLIFYGKSKIKTIIYLTLDLNLTNQHEIIAELAISVQKLQETNTVLKKQLMYTKNLVSEKETDIEQIHKLQKVIEEQLFKDFQKISVVCSKMMSGFQMTISAKILEMDAKISLLSRKVNILKQENNLKCETNERLLKSMENLKLNSNEQLHKLNKLEEENTSLNMMRINLERTITDLKKSLTEQEISHHDILIQNREFEKKLIAKDAAILQKQKAIEELSKDLVQANGMLVNFNSHYDTKCKEVEKLSQALANQEEEIKEVKKLYSDLQIKFDTYRIDWNKEKFDKIMHDLYQANQKIQELEENIRKMNKINILLTEKINRGMGLK